MNCPICGAVNQPGTPACIQCGAQLQAPPTAYPPVAPYAAASPYAAAPPYAAPAAASPSPYSQAAVGGAYGAAPLAPVAPPPYGGYPAAAAATASTIQPFGVTFDQGMAETVFKTGGWMRFLGVLGLVFSILNMLSIFVLNVPGLILGGVGLWLSVVLLGAGKAFKLAAATGDGNQLLMGHAKLRSFFAGYGIVAIVVLSLVALALILALVLGAGALAAMNTGSR